MNKNQLILNGFQNFITYILFFVVAVSVSRFSYFASTTLNPETQGWLFALIVCVCAFYGTTLGVEALSRFSAFVFVLLCLAILCVLLCNYDTFMTLIFIPLLQTKAKVY